MTQHPRVRASLGGGALVGRADHDAGRAAAHNRNVDQVHAEAPETREVHLGEIGPLPGQVFLVVRGQGDVAVLNEVDDHAARRVVGRGRDEYRLADLE